MENFVGIMKIPIEFIPDYENDQIIVKRKKWNLKEWLNSINTNKNNLIDEDI